MLQIAIVDGVPATLPEPRYTHRFCDGSWLWCYEAGEAIPPEHYPQVAAVPQPILWQQFRHSISLNPAFLRIAGHNGATLSATGSIRDLLWRVEEHPELMAEIAELWEYVVVEAVPTTQEIDALQQIVSDCNLPFSLDEDGLIVVGG